MLDGSWMSTSRRPGARLDKLKLRLFAPSHPLIWVHVDFHSCLVDQTAGHATSHGSHLEYPFQTWDGHIPLRLLHPLRKCTCYGRTVPCVQDPIALLQGWHGGEYRDTNLAFPPYPITPAQRAHVAEGIRQLDSRGLASFASLLDPRQED